MNIIQLTFSEFLRNAFQPLKLQKPFEDHTPEEQLDILDKSASVTAWFEDESSTPAIVEQMTSLKEQIDWKGNVTSGSVERVNRRTGAVVTSFRVSFTKEPSRRTTLAGFANALAKLNR